MFLKKLLKSKLHHARVTYADPEYVGSIEIGRELMEAVGLQDGEHVYVWAVDKQARIETYCFGGAPGVIGLNGGAAQYFEPGDRLVIAAFAWTDEDIAPRVVLLDRSNRIIRDMSPFCVHGRL